MRWLVFGIAALCFVGSFMTAMEGARRTATDLLVYGTTPIRLGLFVGLLVVGLIGCAGSVLLMRQRERGRRATLAYLAMIAPVLFLLPEETTLPTLAPFLVALACIVVLTTKGARNVCAASIG